MCRHNWNETEQGFTLHFLAHTLWLMFTCIPNSHLKIGILILLSDNDKYFCEDCGVVD